jgi:branched-chain amino acid aminotransferase
MQVYVNGEFVPREQAKISVFDNGYLFGDGVFEGIRAYGGRIFRLEEHIDRLFDSARAIWLAIPHSRQELMDICAETCAVNDLDDSYIRLVVSRGEGDLGLNPKCAGKPNVVCIAAQISLYPEEFLEKGLRMVTAATRRNYGEVLPPQVKSCNYLPNIMARIEAVNAGAHEAVCMSREGYVAECTGDNIFIVKDGIVKTPHHGTGLLRGITRKAVLEICERLGLPSQETFMNRWDLYTADEIFVSGTAAEVVPVSEIDMRPVGSGHQGPLTRRIREAFRKLVRNEGYPIRRAAAPSRPESACARDPLACGVD